MKDTKRRLFLYGFALVAIAGFSFLLGFILSDQVLVPSSTILEIKPAIRNTVRLGDDMKAPSLANLYSRGTASTGFDEYSQSPSSLSYK